MPLSDELNSPSSSRRYPVIGMLFGFQVFGPANCYGFISSLMRGIRAAAQDRHCGVLLACGINLLKPQTPRPAWPVPTPDSDFVPVGPWNTDGLIVVHPMLSPEREQYVRELDASGFPLVYVGSTGSGPAISLDNDGGIRQAVQHLVEHGHRRIAFIAGYADDDAGDSGQRLRAFQSAARERGLEVDQRLIAWGNHQIGSGRQAMQRILATQASFTAVIASNDEAAYGATQALTEAGLRIPQDIAVIGFDNRWDGTLRLPSLTTVHHPMFERGYRAVELLLDRLQGVAVSRETVVRLPTHLMIRRSCGCDPNELLTDIVASTPASGDPAALQERIVQEMARAIFTETQNQNVADIHQQSRLLIAALALSVRQRQGIEFHRTLRSVLSRLEQAQGDLRVWPLALDAIEDSPDLAPLVQCLGGDNPMPFVQTLLQNARVVIDDCVRRQYWLERESAISEETGLLTARLLRALDDGEILKILAEHLPNVGIRYIAVVSFEAEGDDPLYWSVMRSSAEPEAEPRRFRTREFPPPGFSARAEAFSLVLVPLLVHRGFSGYLVFEPDNLELCATIAHSVNTALASAQMYREALDGRRLAEEANHLKSRFLSTVGHELRTPLSLILATSELLAMEEIGAADRERVQQHLTHIRAGAQHLDGLIRDVLDLTVDEIGQLKLSYQALDLTDVLEPVTVVGEQLARSKGLAWRVDISSSLPPVWGDRARLRQVLLNLVTNAVKFTASGSVELRVQQQGPEIVISVHDTGVGVPPEEQQSIFEDFRKSKRTANRGFGGLGLGLAICRRLAEMHAGRIDVHSSGEDGRGSVFMFCLPVLESGLEMIAKSLPPEQHVLLVEDAPGQSDKLYGQLIRRGFDVSQVACDRLAESISGMVERPPGAVLIEAGLASRHGWEALKTLRENPVTQGSAVLFFALTPDEDAGSVLTLDFLAKPIGTAEMAQALRRQGVEDGETLKTILVVDDAPDLLEMHVKIVQACSPDYRVIKALNGKDALVLIQRQHPDLVLLDLMMPEMDGFAVLEAMQKSETSRHIPVIVLTGQALTGQDMARLNRGVAEVLQKGVFTVEETLTHIQQTLTHRKKTGGEAQRLARRAMAYMHEHFADPLTRREIARHARVSEDHLTRYFQHALGVSPITYLTRYRISRAKALLDAGEMNVADVASAVGFRNEFYFSRVFRRETGMAPSAYRRGRRSSS